MSILYIYIYIYIASKKFLTITIFFPAGHKIKKMILTFFFVNLLNKDETLWCLLHNPQSERYKQLKHKNYNCILLLWVFVKEWMITSCTALIGTNTAGGDAH